MKMVYALIILIFANFSFASDNSCSMNLRIRISTLGSGATKEDLTNLSFSKMGIELNSWLTSTMKLPQNALLNPKAETKKIFEEKGIKVDNSKKYDQELNLNLACSNDGNATACAYSYILPTEKEIRSNTLTIKSSKLDFAIFESISEIAKEISNCTK